MCNSSQKVVPINLEQDCCSFSLCFSLHQLLLQTQKPHPPLFLSLTFFLFITFFSLPSFPLYFFTLHPVVTPRATQGVPTLKKNLIFFFLKFALYQEHPQSQNQEHPQIKKKKKFVLLSSQKKKRKKKEIKSEKKKIVIEPSPWQAQQITKIANPRILKKKKEKKKKKVCLDQFFI